MRVSRSLINFALVSCTIALGCGLFSCKGRTMENMEPTDETVEVVIMQDTLMNNSNTNL